MRQAKIPTDPGKWPENGSRAAKALWHKRKEAWDKHERIERRRKVGADTANRAASVITALADIDPKRAIAILRAAIELLR